MIKQAAHHITLMVLSLVMAKKIIYFDGTNEGQFTAKKKKKTYYGKCKIQTPRPATATMGNVP
jgi:hypothetical protein